MLSRCLFIVPQLTQAFSSVVELWHPHTNSLVQLLQEDPTYLLHPLKIWECDQDLWEHYSVICRSTLMLWPWGKVEWLCGTFRNCLSKYSTSASIRYWSVSRCRHFLTDVSLSLTPCCLIRMNKEKILSKYNLREINNENLNLVVSMHRNSTETLSWYPYSFSVDVLVHPFPLLIYLLSYYW